MATLINENRIASSMINPVRHGKDPVIADIQNLTFNDQLLDDGTLVKNAIFSQLQDQAWMNASKNSATLTNAVKS